MKRIVFCILFLLTTNSLSSQNCLGTESYTLNPTGPYVAGQNVTVTYTLSQFIQVNVNWIIAFDIDYGNGWSNITQVSAPGNPGGSSGSWIWDNQHTFPSGLNFGPGYRFVNSSFWNPDWGTSSTGPFTLSFNLTVGDSCINNDLSINISVIGDCQTGGWNNGACCSITPLNIYSGTSSGGLGNISINEAITPVSCNGLSNGSINTTVNGSYPPFTYNWSNGQTTQNISNLNANNYTLTVTDNLGCTSSEAYTIVNPPAFTPTIYENNISCFGFNDGYIEVVNEPITTTYLWSNSYTTNSINNLSPGNYSVTVTDSNGCALTEFFNIIEPDEIIVSASYNNITCYGENDGVINLNISGGVINYNVNVPPYSQVLSNGITSYSTDSVLSSGIYNYSIIDANNCIVSNTITISEPAQLIATPVISNVLCKDESNGSIILNTSGGTTPYTEDFGGNNPLQLTAGAYTYIITDSNECFISDTFNITEPDSLISSTTSLDASCAGYSDGNATLSIFGGTTPYNTNWNGSNPNALNAGTYNYTITDNNGCISQGYVIIDEPPAMQLLIDTFSVSCYGGSDGYAILNISGGAGAPYNTYWGGMNQNALPAGNHIVTVEDINNCALTDTAFITQPDEIQTNPLITNVSCFLDVNGSAYLQLSGGTPPYSQTWFGVDSSYLAPGTYPYEVIDANNCIKNGTVTIYEPDTLRATTTIINVDCYGYENGSVSLDITGGTPPYITNFGSFNQYELAAGTYNFSITDASGCTFDSIATIEEANQIFLDFTATSPICRYDESTLFINISNALTNTYTMSLQDSTLKSFVIDTNGFLISNGTPITLSPNFSGQIYIISLTDNEGCTQIFNDHVHIEVKQPPYLELNENDLCVGEPSYILNNATPSGGTYFINNEMTNYFDVENLAIGDYTIRYEYTDPITSCNNEVEDIITISTSPEASMLFSPQPTNLEDPNILFRDNSNEDIITSEWHLGDGTIIYDELSFWHTYSNTGTYEIKYYITNIYGCTDSVINNLTINPIYSVFIPDAFSPNNDGDNDEFYPSIIGENSYNMKIYDRWGAIIYNEDNSRWDGTINDDLIINGIYSYSISVLDFNDRLFIYTGLVTLLK